MASRAEWYALVSIGGVGPRRVRGLLNAFGSLDEALAQPDEDLVGKGMLTETHVAQLRKRLARVEEIERQLDDLDMDGIRTIPMDSDAYPSALLTTGRAPALLFVAGDPEMAHGRGVAIVGARNASDGGLEFAQALAARVSEAGLAVISGLAPGIDTAAHEGCLEVGGTPVGVLGSGFGGSRAQTDLCTEVAQHGTLLTELRPGVPPTTANLMARNRIVTGLSYGVVIVELGQTQGTVSTLRSAQSQGRPLFIAAPAAESEVGRAEIAAGAPLIDSPDDLDALVEVASSYEPQPSDDEEDDDGQLRLFT